MTTTTSAHDTFVARNQAFAAAHPGTRPPFEPTQRALVLACADHRSDPAHVLGVQPDEAVVVRNPGGRVIPAFLENLVLLATVAAVEGMGTGFELVVLHHTDCGLSHLDPVAHAGVLAPAFGVEPEQVAGLHLDDPRASVVADVEALRANPMVPGNLVVSGLVYDVDTGEVETLVPPAPLRP